MLREAKGVTEKTDSARGGVDADRIINKGTQTREQKQKNVNKRTKQKKANKRP